MSSDDLAVLCTGDLHLGRHPTRVPEELDGRQFSPAAVWEATVDAAIDRDVDAVLVSGDVVDRENRYVEAYGDFERGAVRLADADVPLVAVAGNHDHDTLPELIGSIERDGVELLGAGGCWERRTIRDSDGEALLHVDGWSFPSDHVLRNPLDEYDPVALGGDGPSVAPGDDGTSAAPVVGLLHADLDARDSDYAPVETADLRSESADAWVLGHVHAPAARIGADPLVLYPGSPQPLDPGEPGTHGPWHLTVERTASAGGNGDVVAEQLPLATLRYDEVAVDVSDAAAPTAIAPAASDRLDEHLHEAGVATGPLELLLARVRLTGRTDLHGALADELSSIEDQLALRRDGLAVRADELTLQTRPAIDLESLVGGDTPAAYLAELLLALEKEKREEKVEKAEQQSGREREEDAVNEAGREREKDTVNEADDEDEPEEGEDIGENEEEPGSDAALADDQEVLVEDALHRLREAYGASAYTRLHREDRVGQPERADAVEALRSQATLLLDELLEQQEGLA